MDHDSYIQIREKQALHNVPYKVLVSSFCFQKLYSSATFLKERIKPALNRRNPVP